MTLSAGTRLGPYEILAPLGAGGMGEVYRARDTRLGRNVAIKVLPERFAQEPERLRRFEGEARSASALSDPHIVTVFDVGEANGIHFFASELVEGADLRSLLDGGALTVRKALDLAGQIASGLASAHDKGIIHRDLKPENILITRAGLAKIADFGLAKLTERSATNVSNLPTSDGRQTSAGVILGTVAYMSPEQVRGQILDHRSDIFSFGAVLHELLTGRKAFERGTAAETMTAILKEDPPGLLESEGIPPALARVVGHCLEKVPEQRFHSLHDVVFALQEAEQQSGATAAVPAAGKWRGSRLVSGIALAAAVALAGAGATWWLMRAPRTALVPTPALTLTRLTSDTGLTTEPALSPDGKLLAFASDRAGGGNLDIYVRQIGGGEPIRLTRDAADEHEPAFSPDGTTVAFRSERQGGAIYVVSALGGPARIVALEGRRPQFSPDGHWIAYYVGGIEGPSLNIRNNCRIYVVPSAGGTPRQLRSDFAAAALPSWTPDGRHLLFLGNPDEKLPLEESIDWWVTPLDSGPAVKTGVLETTRNAKLTGPHEIYPWALLAPAWQPAGDSLVFSATSGDTTNLWRIGMSPKTWKVTRPPERLTSGTAIEQDPSAASGPGGVVRLAFTNLTINHSIWSLPIEPNQGKVTGEPKRLTQEAADDFDPSLSSDGNKMLWISSRSGNQEVWVRDLRTGEESPLTATRPVKYSPTFSPDGSRVSFSESPSWNVYIVPSAGGTPDMVCQGCGEATAWTSDGKRIIGNTVDGQAWVLNLVSRHKTALFKGRHWIWTGVFSPDNRWLAFGDATSQPPRHYVAPFLGESPIGENTWIAVETMGVWSPDGKLLYDTLDRDGFLCIWTQRLDPATMRAGGAPYAVFHSPHNVRISIDNWLDIGRDKILFSMGERTGNIWMAEWKP
jgi:eukaryotic-like serine/threonine-protein kinase